MKIERCGFCGRFFQGKNYLTSEELNKMNQDELNKAPIGYCPEANYESEQEDYLNPNN